MNSPFLFQMWHQSHGFRGILLVIIAIFFVWAVIYSKFNHNLRLLLKGILLIIIVICLLMIITDCVSPNQLAILGIAIVCLSFIPKSREKGRDDDWRFWKIVKGWFRQGLFPRKGLRKNYNPLNLGARDEKIWTSDPFVPN